MLLPQQRATLTGIAMSTTAQPGIIDWQYLAFLFSNISPYYWSYVGIGLCVGLSILGSAWCVLLLLAYVEGAGHFHMHDLHHVVALNVVRRR